MWCPPHTQTHTVDRYKTKAHPLRINWYAGAKVTDREGDVTGDVKVRNVARSVPARGGEQAVLVLALALALVLVLVQY